MLIEAKELRKRLLERSGEEVGLVQVGIDYAIEVLNLYEGECMEKEG